MEQLDYNLLFRWFVGLSMDEPVWDASVCNKNRDRLLEADIAAAFLAAVLNLAEMKLLSTEHFTVGRHADGLAHLKRRGFAPKSIIDVDVLYGTHELYEAFPGARLFLFGPNPNRPQDQVLDFVDLVFVRKNSRLRPLSWQPTCRPLPAGKSPCHEPKEGYTGQFVFA